MTDDLEQLRKAVEGLLYPSESDRPFEVMTLGPAGRMDSPVQMIRTLAPGRKIVEQPADEFFSALRGSDEAERFAQLRVVAESTLRRMKIYRVGVGETAIDVYVVGRTRSNAWAALHTVSIET